MGKDLENMNHPQPPTPIFTDNYTARVLSNETLKIGQDKLMYMRFHWIRDRIKQNQHQILCLPGSSNKEDYFSKNHPPTHQRKMRSPFLRVNESIT